MSQFNPINPPFGWEESWTKYPHGYTIYEALMDWLKTVNHLIDHSATLEQNIVVIRGELDNFLSTVPAQMQAVALAILNEWLTDGTLANLINTVLFAELDDKIEDIAVSVKKFGAVGDGVTDDTVAIQNAINASRNIFIPQGNYRITSPLVGRTALKIAGVNRFLSKITADGCNGIVFDGDIYYFNLSDFSIFGNDLATPLNTGLTLANGCAKYLIYNLNIEHFNVGMSFYSSYLSEIYSPFIQNCNIGVQLSGPSNGFGAHAHTFVGGEIVNCNIGVSAKYGNATKFYGTTIEQCAEFGVFLEASNELRNFKLDTVYMEANHTDIAGATLSNIRIENCFITSVGKPVGGKFIATDNILRVKIENNVFSGTQGQHIDRLNAGAVTYVLDANIQNNDIIDGTPLKIHNDFKTVVIGEGVSATSILQGLNDLKVHINKKSPHIFVGCRVFHSVAQNIATGDTPTLLVFDSESYDTDTMHSTSSLTSRITIKTEGKYRITAQIQWAPNVTGKRVLYIRKNEAFYVALDSRDAVSMTSSSTAQSLSVVVDASLNDYYEVMVVQDSGATLAVNRTNDFSAIFSAEKID